jgi:hypothetical protein
MSSLLENMSANFIVLSKVSLKTSACTFTCSYVQVYIFPTTTNTLWHVLQISQSPEHCVTNTNRTLAHFDGRAFSAAFFSHLSLAAADKGDGVSKGYWEIIVCAIISWKRHRCRLLRLHCKKARIIDNVALTRWWKISDLYTEHLMLL